MTHEALLRERLTPELMHFAHAFNAWREGIPPDAGGSQDQAETFLTAASILSVELEKAREQKRELEEKQAERKRGRNPRK